MRRTFLVGVGLAFAASSAAAQDGSLMLGLMRGFPPALRGLPPDATTLNSGPLAVGVCSSSRMSDSVIVRASISDDPFVFRTWHSSSGAGPAEWSTDGLPRGLTDTLVAKPDGRICVDVAGKYHAILERSGIWFSMQLDTAAAGSGLGVRGAGGVVRNLVLIGTANGMGLVTENSPAVHVVWHYDQARNTTVIKADGMDLGSNVQLYVAYVFDGQTPPDTPNAVSLIFGATGDMGPTGAQWRFRENHDVMFLLGGGARVPMSSSMFEGRTIPGGIVEFVTAPISVATLQRIAGSPAARVQLASTGLVLTPQTLAILRELTTQIAGPMPTANVADSGVISPLPH